jgi:hypothetical protein
MFQQLQWCRHVQRMEEGRLPKEVMKWRPPARRYRGRLNSPGRKELEDWLEKRDCWRKTGTTDTAEGRRQYN